MKERLLRPDELHLVRESMMKLSAYHNTVKTHPDFEFRGIYVDTTLERLAVAIPKGESKVKVLEKDGEIIGFAVVELNEEARRGFLGWIFIEEAYRGQGHGGGFMDWAMEEFRAIRAEQIDITVICGNPAIGLYEKYGFAPRTIQMTRCDKYL